MSRGQISPWQRDPIWKILAWMVVGLVVTAALTYVIFSLLAVATDDNLGFWAAHQHDRPQSLLRAAVPAAVLLAAGAAGAVGILRQRSVERTHTADEVSRLRDRYTAAAEQLGHDAAPVRLAGVYAMAALADDWLKRKQRLDAQVCVDVLCAYFRTLRPRSEVEEEDQAEQQVRETIIRVITDHLRDPKRKSSWCGMNFDFTGAHFCDGTYDFADAQFTDGGEMSFTEAHFASARVYFIGAHFTGGRVFFIGAHFAGAKVSFTGAHFTGSEVRFELARFTGGVVDFDAADVTGGTMGFNSAGFYGGSLRFNVSELAIDVPGPWVSKRPPPLFPP